MPTKPIELNEETLTAIAEAVQARLLTVPHEFSERFIYPCEQVVYLPPQRSPVEQNIIRIQVLETTIVIEFLIDGWTRLARYVFSRTA